jgi:ubiquinone/menaquinone biosynthesis C-methylase UbiE
MDSPSDLPVNHHAEGHRFAGPFGLLIALGMLAFARKRARLVVEVAGLSSADHAVDIGCGPGAAVRAAARSGARVTGVDPAPLMLRLARIVTRNGPNVVWSQGSAENLPLPEHSVTAAWSVATVHHWEDVAAGLAEVRRVLAPGGRFFAVERQVQPGATGLASHGWTDQQANSFGAMCRTAGFDDVHIETRNVGRRLAHVVRAVRR